MRVHAGTADMAATGGGRYGTVAAWIMPIHFTKSQRGTASLSR